LRIGFIERNRACLIEREPVVELIERDGARGRRWCRTIGLQQRLIPKVGIDAPALVDGKLPTQQAAHEGAVAGGARGLQPGLEASRMLRPPHPAPALAYRQPLGEVIENKGAKGGSAAGIKPRTPKPGETGKGGIAPQPLQVIGETLIVGLALEQLLD